MPGVGPQTTSNLTSTTHIEYVAKYTQSAMRKRLYDQLAKTIEDNATQHNASTLTTPYLSAMTINRTAISETIDLVPQALREGTTSLSPNMYGDVLQASQKAKIFSYANYRERMAPVVGENAMMVLEALAIDAALAGGNVRRAAARASIDAGTAGHRASGDLFSWIASTFQYFNAPGWGAGDRPTSWAAITDPFVVRDIVITTPVLLAAQYNDTKVVLKDELGMIGAFRLVSSGQAKMFLDAGIDNSSAVNTTLSSAGKALDTTIVVAANTNIVVGQWLNIINTEETSNTFYPDNERVRVTAIASTTISISGQGDNGGLLYDHASGQRVANADSVHTILLGGPESLDKTWAPEIGEYGEMVEEVGGALHQWTSVGWKWFGAYARKAEKVLYRAEVSVSEEA